MPFYSVCHFRVIFNANLSRAHYDTTFTDRDTMFSAPDYIIGHFAAFGGRPLDTLNADRFEFSQLLHNDFFKQRFITFYPFRFKTEFTRTPKCAEPFCWEYCLLLFVSVITKTRPCNIQQFFTIVKKMIFR